MAEWFEVLEIAGPGGEHTGKFRMTRRTDDPAGGPYGLCDHEHDSRGEARDCPEVVEQMDAMFPRKPRPMEAGDTFPEPDPA